MAKLVLIDGNALMHRAYHALPKTFTNKKGEPTNAVFGFASMLLKVISDLRPTHIAVAFDRKEPTFRKKLLEEYQAHRPEMDKSLGEQFPKAKELIRAMNIPIYEKAGFEADDLIGTIATKVTDEVIIVTGDRDILQLVSQKTKVYLLVKGLGEAKLMTRSDVEEKLGVPPERIDDYKALVGDASDNYKGVAGIGPKTAVLLIKKFGDLEGIYKNIDKVPQRVADRLRKGKNSAQLSFKLAQIVTDVDIDFNLDDCGRWSLDNPSLDVTYRELGFRSIATRTKKLAKQINSRKQEILF